MLAGKKSILAVLLTFVSLNVFATTTILLSTGADLVVYELKGGNLEKKYFATEPWDFITATKPSWNTQQRSIVFEGLENKSRSHPGIYELHQDSSGMWRTFRWLLSGQNPSVSPTGKYLAYTDKENNLFVRDLTDNEDTFLAKQQYSTPAIWYGDRALVYRNAVGDVVLSYVPDGDALLLKQTDLIPVSACYSKRSIYLSNYSGKQLISYGIESKGFDDILSLFYLTIRGSVLFTPVCDGFFYARNTWRSFLKFREVADIFFRTLDGKERLS